MSANVTSQDSVKSPDRVDTHHLLVIIPAYNAARHLPELIKRFREALPHTALLIVDDGSTDDTQAFLKEQGIPHITHAQNRGKGAALATGFRYALAHRFRSVVTIDADLQHPPEEIPRLLACDDGATIVMGTRSISLRGMPLPRWLVNNLTSLIISVFSTTRVRDSQSGFRLLPVTLLRRIGLHSVNYDFESELLFKAGALGVPVKEVTVSTVYNDSASHIRPGIDTLRFIRQIWRRIWA
ncbi:MAG: glycosyltransferase family 2 protein [Candidatus Zixiibacteriota bacterium]|nr:MAG: glycosyltransferase family 2 protein [candidate division Zixibacteria bacterium]